MERDFFFGISGGELAAADSDGTRNPSPSMQEGFASSISRRMPLDHASRAGLLQPLTPPNALESSNLRYPQVGKSPNSTCAGALQRSWITESHSYLLPGYLPSSADSLLLCRDYLDEGWQFRRPSSPRWALSKPTITQPGLADPGRRSKEKNPAHLSTATAGMVNVYDDIPADKAEAIMLMAAKDLRSMKSHARTSSRIRDESEGHHKAPPASSRAIPQARKASLARFLEKRKERMVSAAPYSTSSEI